MLRRSFEIYHQSKETPIRSKWYQIMQMFSWSLPHMRKSIKFRYSCVNQLLAITHETFCTFDDIFENRGVFFDISNVFDKV